MKNSVIEKLMVILLVLVCSGMTSCSNSNDDSDIIWDFTPVVVGFEVVNSEGHDMLALNKDLYLSDFAIIYNNEKFDVNWIAANGSRHYNPTLYGLFYTPAQNDQKARLLFGELAGDLGEASLTLQMPGGIKHEIHISRHITIKDKELSVKQTVTMDGKEIDSLTDGNPFIKLTVIYD